MKVHKIYLPSPLIDKHHKLFTFDIVKGKYYWGNYEVAEVNQIGDGDELWMQGTAGVDSEATPQGSGEDDLGESVEGSTDTVIVADALSCIGEGLFAIAKSINRLAAAQEPDGINDPEELETYLDGTPKR